MESPTLGICRKNMMKEEPWFEMFQRVELREWLGVTWKRIMTKGRKDTPVFIIFMEEHDLSCEVMFLLYKKEDGAATCLEFF